MSTALTGMVFNARRGRLKRTGQIMTYHRGDDGAERKGLLEQFVVETLGQYSGTNLIEVASYAAPTISFAAPNQVNDAAGGLAHILTGDTVVIKGSPLNSGTFVVAGGGVAAGFTVVAGIVNEGAGAYVKLYKQTPHLNSCVRDLRTGLMWSRTTSNGEKVGTASTGSLVWYDPALIFPLHGAAADLQMVVPGNILRIVGGAAEITRYHAGDLLQPGGFAGANNNLPGLYVVSATVNGADLDILVDPMGLPALTAEAAGGARTIGLVTRSIYNYAAGANLIGLAGYTDWRPPNKVEGVSLMSDEVPGSAPDAIAFPGWPAAATAVWSSGTQSSNAANAYPLSYLTGCIPPGLAKTTAYYAALVRP